MTGIKTLFLCGASRDERLFVVEIHVGFSRKAPLGARNGLLLRWPTHPTSPPTAIVHLPPLEPRANTRGMGMEVMRAGLAGEDVVFLLSIEVGEKQQRERFEWRDIKKWGRRRYQIERVQTRASVQQAQGGPSARAAVVARLPTPRFLLCCCGLPVCPR
ncbi:hypothetical protein LY76DRAFT_593195 [Colletotrichum caudatum]|nr:hypothetical protein LY76DRAFT_598365 [Colletotrichum caudatum]KAK2058558.1 hypothetical protein LY76DRAFT_593195 [Colletotrichum caudatum]